MTSDKKPSAPTAPLAALVARHEDALRQRLVDAGYLMSLEADAALAEFHRVATTYQTVMSASPAPDDLPSDFAVSFLQKRLTFESQQAFENAFRRVERQRAGCADVWKGSIAATRSNLRRAGLLKGGGA